MEQATTGKDKIVDALKLLEEAAKQKKEELQGLASDKYTNLKEVLVGTEQSISESLLTAKKRAAEAAARARDAGEERVKLYASELDESVRANPWPYIGAAALVSLLVGFILGRSK